MMITRWLVQAREHAAQAWLTARNTQSRLRLRICDVLLDLWTFNGRR